MASRLGHRRRASQFRPCRMPRRQQSLSRSDRPRQWQPRHRRSWWPSSGPPSRIATAQSSTIPPPRASGTGKTTAAYRAKRERDLSVVTRSKSGFKSTGFWYTSFSTTIAVESIDVSGSQASVRFNELTEEYLASSANGPSSVPSGYSLPQTATFLASADGWQLDSIAPSVHGHGLPMSVVEG